MSILQDGRKEAAFLIGKSFPYVIDTMADLSGVLNNLTIGERSVMAEGHMSAGDAYTDLYVARAYGIIVENLIGPLRKPGSSRLDYTAIFYTEKKFITKETAF